MKTSKQGIQDLLAQLAADIEEIKTMLNGSAAGVSAGVAGKSYAVSNDMAVGKDSASRATATDYSIAGKNPANANLDRFTAEINRI